MTYFTFSICNPPCDHTTNTVLAQSSWNGLMRILNRPSTIYLFVCDDITIFKLFWCNAELDNFQKCIKIIKYTTMNVKHNT